MSVVVWMQCGEGGTHMKIVEEPNEGKKVYEK